MAGGAVMPSGATFGFRFPANAGIQPAALSMMSQGQQTPSALAKIFGDYGYEGGGRTLGGGGLAFGSRRGNEMFAPVSPLAMSLRNIKSSDQGQQDYKLALMQGGINPYDDLTWKPSQAGTFGQFQQQQEQADRRQMKRGREVYDITKDFVKNYQGGGVGGTGTDNAYQQFLQQRAQAGSANPTGDFGGYRSFLSKYLGGQ